MIDRDDDDDGDEHRLFDTAGSAVVSQGDPFVIKIYLSVCLDNQRRLDERGCCRSVVVVFCSFCLRCYLLLQSNQLCLHLANSFSVLFLNGVYLLT